LIFTGTDSVFASGADLREISALNSETAPEFAAFGQQLMKKIEGLDQLTLSAVNGYCFGGALDLALSCKIRIAAPTAKFAHPGTGLGIITGWGGTQRLPRLLGQANAFELFFTAEPVDSNRALTIGLVDEIATEPLERAIGLSRLADVV
jgi:enoyl-CoA hydratase/carnithine racemase